MPSWLDVGGSLPEWAAPALLGLSVASAVGLLVAVLALPKVLGDLPVDYLHTEEPAITDPRRWALRTALALLLGLAGLAMLVLPGQGVLTLLAAGVVSPWRGKKRLVRWLLDNDVVYAGVDLVRRRRGVPSLTRSGSSPTTASPSGSSAVGGAGEGATPTRRAPEAPTP